MGKMQIIEIFNYAIGVGKTLISFLINKPQYKEWHLRSSIIKPMRIIGKKHISIGNGVTILNNARIEAISKYAGTFYSPNLLIHDGVTIQQNVHITCANKVEIGENTAIVANVTITDIIHPYTAENKHLIVQPLIVLPVTIGKYCGIYNNVVINAGVTIGDHVTIGANSVVTHDIPSYSVAVGNPARVIKRYNEETQRWEKTDKHGSFIEK